MADASVQILDKDMYVIVAGKTDSNGKFIYSDLPKGTYYIAEVKAPKGYRLNEEFVSFEIKEDGKVVDCNMINYRVIT